jgi:hypothetical protein
MSAIISRTKAKRLTLLYQAAAVVCVLGAVGIGIVGLPESAETARMNSVSQPPQTPIPGVNSDPNAGSTPSDTQTPFNRIDPSSIAARLAMLDNAPQITSAPEIVPTEDEFESLPEESGSIAKLGKYTGYINDSAQPLAFIRIDGTQRIVAQGGIARAGSLGLDDLTVKAVRPKFILVADGQTEERIELATNNGASITMSSGSDGGIDAKPLREEDVVLTPEERERLSKMPARQRAMQERILRNKKLGREVGSFERKPLASFRAGFGNDQNKKKSNND